MPAAKPKFIFVRLPGVPSQITPSRCVFPSGTLVFWTKESKCSVRAKNITRDAVFAHETAPIPKMGCVLFNVAQEPPAVLFAAHRPCGNSVRTFIAKGGRPAGSGPCSERILAGPWFAVGPLFPPLSDVAARNPRLFRLPPRLFHAHECIDALVMATVTKTDQPCNVRVSTMRDVCMASLSLASCR